MSSAQIKRVLVAVQKQRPQRLAAMLRDATSAADGPPQIDAQQPSGSPKWSEDAAASTTTSTSGHPAFDIGTNAMDAIGSAARLSTSKEISADVEPTKATTRRPRRVSPWFQRSVHTDVSEALDNAVQSTPAGDGRSSLGTSSSLFGSITMAPEDKATMKPSAMRSMQKEAERLRAIRDTSLSPMRRAIAARQLAEVEHRVTDPSGHGFDAFDADEVAIRTILSQLTASVAGDAAGGRNDDSIPVESLSRQSDGPAANVVESRAGATAPNVAPLGSGSDDLFAAGETATAAQRQADQQETDFHAMTALWVAIERSALHNGELAEALTNHIRTVMHRLVSSEYYHKAIRLYHLLCDVGMHLTQADLKQLLGNMPYERASVMPPAEELFRAQSRHDIERAMEREQQRQQLGVRGLMFGVNEAAESRANKGPVPPPNVSELQISDAADETSNTRAASAQSPAWDRPDGLSRWLTYERAMGTLDPYADPADMFASRSNDTVETVTPTKTETETAEQQLHRTLRTARSLTDMGHWDVSLRLLHQPLAKKSGATENPNLTVTDRLSTPRLPYLHNRVVLQHYQATTVAALRAGRHWRGALNFLVAQKRQMSNMQSKEEAELGVSLADAERGAGAATDTDAYWAMSCSDVVAMQQEQLVTVVAGAMMASPSVQTSKPSAKQRPIVRLRPSSSPLRKWWRHVLAQQNPKQLLLRVRHRASSTTLPITAIRTNASWAVALRALTLGSTLKKSDETSEINLPVPVSATIRSLTLATVATRLLRVPPTAGQPSTASSRLSTVLHALRRCLDERRSITSPYDAATIDRGVAASLTELAAGLHHELKRPQDVSRVARASAALLEHLLPRWVKMVQSQLGTARRDGGRLLAVEPLPGMGYSEQALRVALVASTVIQELALTKQPSRLRPARSRWIYHRKQTSPLLKPAEPLRLEWRPMLSALNCAFGRLSVEPVEGHLQNQYAALRAQASLAVGMSCRRAAIDAYRTNNLDEAAAALNAAVDALKLVVVDWQLVAPSTQIGRSRVFTGRSWKPVPHRQQLRAILRDVQSFSLHVEIPTEMLKAVGLPVSSSASRRGQLLGRALTQVTSNQPATPSVLLPSSAEQQSNGISTSGNPVPSISVSTSSQTAKVHLPQSLVQLLKSKERADNIDWGVEKLPDAPGAADTGARAGSGIGAADIHAAVLKTVRSLGHEPEALNAAIQQILTTGGPRGGAVQWQDSVAIIGFLVQANASSRSRSRPAVCLNDSTFNCAATVVSNGSADPWLHAIGLYWAAVDHGALVGKTSANGIVATKPEARVANAMLPALHDAITRSNCGDAALSALYTAAEASSKTVASPAQPVAPRQRVVAPIPMQPKRIVPPTMPAPPPRQQHRTASSNCAIAARVEREASSAISKNRKTPRQTLRGGWWIDALQRLRRSASEANMSIHDTRRGHERAALKLLEALRVGGNWALSTELFASTVPPVATVSPISTSAEGEGTKSAKNWVADDGRRYSGRANAFLMETIGRGAGARAPFLSCQRYRSWQRVVSNEQTDAPSTKGRPLAQQWSQKADVALVSMGLQSRRWFSALRLATDALNFPEPIELPPIGDDIAAPVDESNLPDITLEPLVQRQLLYLSLKAAAAGGQYDVAKASFGLLQHLHGPAQQKDSGATAEPASPHSRRAPAAAATDEMVAGWTSLLLRSRQKRDSRALKQGGSASKAAASSSVEETLSVVLYDEDEA